MTLPDHFITRPLDIIIADDWFTGEVYPKAMEYLRDKGIKTIVDIGASSGTISYFMLALQPEMLFAFEPDTDNFALLENNMRPYNNVQIINKAIFYGKDTVAVNGTGDNNFLGYMIADIAQEHTDFWQQLHPYEGKLFHCAELEDYMENDSADLIKIDVEGSEYNIIEHSLVVYNSRYILLETHNHGIDYVLDYIAEHLQHRIVFSQGIGIHLGFLLEKK